MRLVRLAILFAFFAFVTAAVLRRQEELQKVTDAEISDRYIPAAIISGAAACGNRAVEAFDCGPACDSLKEANAEVLYSDGDGANDPYVYLLHMPEDEALVIAHSPTNFSSFLSVLIDADFLLSPIEEGILGEIDTELSSKVSVHSGFLRSVSKTLEELKKRLIEAMDRLGDSIKVIRFEGHSMGAASASIEAVLLSNIVYKRGYDLQLTTFGSPRVGDESFVNLLESVIPEGKRARITNQNDKVPHLPGFPYKHYSGEVYIPKDDEKDIPLPAAHCVGREDERCADKFNFFQRSKDAHEGPYFGQVLGRTVCTNPDAYPPK
ncbi:alpha/beta-hydrolase [Wallemia mellicola]|uniref:Alpha/beta-hydrolase n=1 Tax=Wallemia mellicola TaxID=1708541 RepID=A0A4T0PNK9_9BASI|nr:alpha/beta-hydrolase [Wallemia mellicola]TIC24691.1 alpha/beta-hydrolase [Wallemia mellicola]TIC49702.1 alpha/beta-hydrolase [Wallemia mellicola]